MIHPRPYIIIAKKGYIGEYRAKKELQAIYGDDNVIKIAIAQIGADFMVIKDHKLILLVEVKETIKKKYYPKPRERLQFERIRQFAEANSTRAELWIYHRKGIGRPVQKVVSMIYLES